MYQKFGFSRRLNDINKGFNFIHIDVT